MPVNRKLLAGVIAGSTAAGTARSDRTKPPGLILGAADEAADVERIAKLGAEAFRQGVQFGGNPFNSLRQRNFYDAWATGWKGAQMLAQVDGPISAIQTAQ